MLSIRQTQLGVMKLGLPRFTVQGERDRELYGTSRNVCVRMRPKLLVDTTYSMHVCILRRYRV